MAIKVQGTTVIDDSRDIINIGVATIGSIDVNKISPDGSDFGTSNYVPVADGSGTWSWQPVTSAGAGILDGIIIKEEGSTVGTAGSITTLNFVGNNITATAVSGGAIATITASDTPTFDTLGIGTRIDLIPYDTIDNGTLSFEGSAGQLFSITNNLTSGSIFSVNDVSGIPSIDVDADGTIQLAPYGSTEYVGIGTTNPTAKLDVNGTLNVTGIATFQGNVNLGDNDKINLGDGNDLQIYHNGSENYIDDAGVGSLLIRTLGNNNISLQNSTGNMLNAVGSSGAVELYYGNSKKFETTGAGVTVYGTTQTQQLNVSGVSTFSANVYLGDDDRMYFGANTDLQLYHDGSDSYVRDNGSGSLIVAGDEVKIQNSSLTQTKAVFTTNGAVELNHNGTKKFETTADGIAVNSNVGLGTVAGNSQTIADFRTQNSNASILKIVEERDVNGTSWTSAYTRIQKTIDVTDQAYIQFNGDGLNYGMEFGTQNDEKFAVFKKDNTVELYYDNDKKFETTGIGISVVNGTSDTATIAAPANLILDPAAVGDNTGVVRIKGDLFVDGTTTQINSTSLEIADFVVGIASTATTDLLTDGAGIKIGPDNTFLYEHNGGTNPSLKSSENLNVATGKVYQIAETERLSADTLSVGTGATVHSPGSNILTLGTNGEEIVRVTSAGDVGIGTDDPQEKLDVRGNLVVGGSASSNYIAFTGTTGDLPIGGKTWHSFIGERIYGSTEKSELLILKDNDASTSTGPDRVRIVGANIQFDTYSANNSHATFEAAATDSNNTLALLIDQSGDVGIGTDNPIYKLDVRGDIHFFNNAIIASDGGSGNVDHFWHSDNTDYGKGGVWHFVSDSTYKATGNSAIRAGAFANMNDTGTASQNLQVTGGAYVSGNLGVGATNPSVGLELGLTKGSNQIKLKSSDGNVDMRINPAFGNADVASVTVVGAHPLTFHTSNTERIRIEAGGDVGIGTDDPQQKLHVKGTIQVDGTSAAINGNYSRIYQNSSGSVDYGLQLKHYQGDTDDVDAAIIIGGDTSSREGNIVFYRDVSGTFTETARFTESGRLGIGTDDPQKKLHVYGDVMSGGGVGGSYVVNLNPSGTGPILEFGDVADPDKFMSLGASGGTNNLGIANRDFKISSSSVTNLLYIADDTGNIGINTTAPGSTLAVGGTITELHNGTYWNVVTQADVGYGASQVPLNQYLGQLAFLDDYHPNGLRRDGGGSDDVVVSAGGTVGIGTDTVGVTGYALEVRGNVYFSNGGTGTDALNMSNGGITAVHSLTFNDPGPNEGIKWNGGSGWEIYESPNDLTTNSAGNLQFVDGTSRVFTLDTSGNAEFTGHVKVDSGPTLEENSGSLLVSTPSNGYIQLGPVNSSYCHFQTDRTRFFFNRKLIVDEGIISSYNDDLVLSTNTASDERVRILSSNGYVGINTASPSYQLHVNGSFAATTKSFVIDHPTKDGMKLRYGSLEGPENGVYVRGRLKGNDTIELPEHWTGLVDDETITVNLTPIGRKAPLHSVVDIADNTVVVESANDVVDCFYTVFGERKDVEKLEVEF